jgi:hypothetical protein
VDLAASLPDDKRETLLARLKSIEQQYNVARLFAF